jgi:AsmA protein
MNKILKYLLLGAGGIVGVTVVGAAYLATIFNPNDFKARIVQSVQESTQRTLHLDGDIKFSFFPTVGAELGKVSLSGAEGETGFAAVERARLSLAVLPLLRREMVVDEVFLSGVHINLVKHKDGSTNIDGLLASKREPGHKASARHERSRGDTHRLLFDISSVSINKTSLTYRDEATGALYAIKDGDLVTGRIANNLPTRIALSAAVQAKQLKMDLATQLKATLKFDPAAKRYRLEGMDLQASGSAFDINKLKLQVNGDVGADLTSQEFSVERFTLKATGVKATDTIAATLETPALSLTKDKFSGEKLILHALLNGESGGIVADLSLPGLEGDAQSFKGSAGVLDLDVHQPGQAFTMKLASPVSGSFQARELTMDKLNLALQGKSDRLPGKSLSSEMKGAMRVDMAKQSVQAELSGRVLQSQVKARVGLRGFASPAIRFDVDADQFDAEPYQPEKEAHTEVTSPAPKSAKGAGQPPDLSAWRNLNLDGSLRIGALKVGKVKATQVHLELKAHNGQVSVSPFSANLYEGSVTGALQVNARATPTITIKQKFTGVNVAPLTKDVAGFDSLEGKGDIAINLTTEGRSVSEMKRALNGTMSLELAKGAIKGINIAEKLREAESLVAMGGGEEQTQPASSVEKTGFSKLKATFEVEDGVAHNDDLFLGSPLLRMGGEGKIDFGNERMNYVATATLVKAPKGRGARDILGGLVVPVRAKGPFRDLKYTLDLKMMIREMAKKRTEGMEDEVKTKVHAEIRRVLKRWFK